MNKLIMIIASVCFVNAPAFAESSEDQTPASLGSWGLEAGFGQRPYAERNSRIGVLSPILFSAGRSQVRLVASLRGETLMGVTDGNLGQTALHLEFDSPIYKEVAYSYVRAGFGFMTLNGQLYDGSLLIAPISLGLQVITGAYRNHTLSFFVEYSFYVWNDFKSEKSVPEIRKIDPSVSLDKNVLFQGTTTFGLRFVF